MKHAKKLTALSLSLLLLFSVNLYACGTAEEDTATYIELSDESVEIAVGESYTLTADTDGQKSSFHERRNAYCQSRRGRRYNGCCGG